MPRKDFLILLIAALVSLGGYLVWSGLGYGSGYPLDDAWIHQTYARNLAEYGEWSFVTGIPSGGSTAPLWSGLLSLGYFLGLNHYVWTYSLGGLGLVALGVIAYRATLHFVPNKRDWALLAGIIIIFEWHLVWAAGSGMETLIQGVMIAYVLVTTARLTRQDNLNNSDLVKLGILIAVSVWIRPDGLTLLGPALWTIYFVTPSMKQRVVRAAAVLGGFALIAAPYLLFNQAIAGDWLPNTFYAKQAEYRELQKIPYLSRYFSQVYLPLVGAGVLLAPAAVYFFIRMWRAKRYAVFGGAIWWLGYAGIYAWRLPVTYQHGRYLIPAMPVLFLWGALGLAMAAKSKTGGMWGRVLRRGWTISVGAALFVFWGLGAQSFSNDVGVINTEMIATAYWIQENIPLEESIAAHDIGALGYFANRPIVDLAGLVSPDVIPFIRDEPALASHLDSLAVDYLITLEGWYPTLESRSAEVYSTDGDLSPTLGGTNMKIYQWGGDSE